ncbi:high-temperature-induced dauer-formation protein-domain-containing protein [Jimgerdemannia flammicorona]|uniref:High-temperature-induced dauer-formation protein-domain-containing protein n=1 Tax=Jimgerdemannia flammicorona TaxID=994334 RepID=A0A433D499_9FUNG|nr:high-temperature-induced dauer-formation protein-domain-containing protein [Jimgerdemannia flammicorona]
MGITDSKLAFRKGVFRLFEERFWLLPESVDDVFSLVGASDIRRVRDQARENLETLLEKIVDRLITLLYDPAFPSSSTATLQVLNCVRVLTRLIPFIYENEELVEWEDRLFWTADESSVEDREDAKEAVLDLLFLVGFTIPSTIATDTSRINHVIWETGVGSSTPITSSKECDSNRTETLRLLIVLLSKSMYTQPSVVLAKENRWTHHVVARTERKVVLALLCSLLNTAVKYNPLGWGVPYNHVVFSDPRELLVTLCLQNLLVLLDYHSPGHAHYQTDALPHAIPVVASGSGSTTPSIQDPEKRALAERERPATTGTDPLTAVEFAEVPSSPITEQKPSGSKDGKETTVQDNAFRYYLSKLHRAQDFQFLMDGIYRILSNPMQANNTYLPGSTKQVRCHVEMMMLCWKLLEINKRFRNYLLETDRVLDVLVVLLYYALEYKLNAAQIGLVRMCAFILQTLSSDRAFGVKLNKVFDGHSSLPPNVRIQAFHGSYADFLIISIYILIATTRGSLSTLYPALLLTITNVSPYLKNLSVVSSNKLVSLFGSFSAPGFILADEGNHRLVEYLLEAFDYVIQYQYADNSHFIYAVIRSHGKFEDLHNFTLAKGLAEVERLRLAKEEKRRLAQLAAEQLKIQATGDAAEDGAARSLLSHAESSGDGNLAAASAAESLDEKTALARADDNDDQHAGPLSPNIVTSPTYLEAGRPQEDLGPLSEKARGKLPENAPARTFSSSSLNSNGTTDVRRRSTSSLLVPPHQGVVAVGKNGFVPTEDWVATWHPNLPLGTTLTLCQHLVPQVEDLCSTQSPTTDGQVLEFLRAATLVGILPHPRPVHVRRFVWGEALVIWFRSLLWGQAYLASLSSFGVWNGTYIRLFQIKHANPMLAAQQAHGHSHLQSHVGAGVHGAHDNSAQVGSAQVGAAQASS